MKTIGWFNNNSKWFAIFSMLFALIILYSTTGVYGSTYEYSSYRVEGNENFDGFFIDATENALNETSPKDLKGNFQYQCNYYVSNRIFSYLAAQQIPDDKVVTVVNGTTNLIYFSFWNDNQLNTCMNLGPSDDRSAVLLQYPNRNCYRVSADNWEDATIELIKNEDDRNKDSLRLSWTGMDKWTIDNSKQWKFSVDIMCTGGSYEDSTFYYTGGFDSSCELKTVISSKIGCAIVNFNIIWEFFENNSTIFAIVLIAVGFFLAFFGYRIVIISLFLAGMLATTFALMIVMYQFIFSQNAKTWVAWVTLVVSLIIGIWVGYVVAKFRRFGVFLLAFSGGAVLGFVLNNAFMRYAQSQALFWIVIVACGAACGILSCFLYVLVAILSTSLAGSYAFVRGISLFIGHFPNEFTVM